MHFYSVPMNTYDGSYLFQTDGVAQLRGLQAIRVNPPIGMNQISAKNPYRFSVEFQPTHNGKRWNSLDADLKSAPHIFTEHNIAPVLQPCEDMPNECELVAESVQGHAVSIEQLVKLLVEHEYIGPNEALELTKWVEEYYPDEKLPDAVQPLNDARKAPIRRPSPRERRMLMPRNVTRIQLDQESDAAHGPEKDYNIAIEFDRLKPGKLWEAFIARFEQRAQKEGWGSFVKSDVKAIQSGFAQEITIKTPYWARVLDDLEAVGALSAAEKQEHFGNIANRMPTAYLDNEGAFPNEVKTIVSVPQHRKEMSR